MASPTRFPASKSILLVWILNIFILGLGNIYASGLSALRWLIIGILIRVFVHQLGVLLGAYVLLSLIAMGEIIAVSGLPKPPKTKKIQELQSRHPDKWPKAVNAPSESLMSTRKIRHEEPPENLDELTDEFVRQHLVQKESHAASPEQAIAHYDDLHAGQLTYDALSATPFSFDTPKIEFFSLPEMKYEFPEYKFDSLDYQNVGAGAPASTLPSTQNTAFACPHCGVQGQHDFSFCLSCGHAYAIG